MVFRLKVSSFELKEKLSKELKSDELEGDTETEVAFP
jgi:hypothetical protein